MSYLFNLKDNKNLKKTTHSKKCGGSNFFSYFKKNLVLFSLIILPFNSTGSVINLQIDDTLENEFSKPIVSNNVLMNLEEEIHLNFSNPVSNFENYEKNISIFPNENLNFVWNDEKNKLKISPKKVWQPQTQYTLSIPKLKNQENGLSYLFSFETLAYPKVTKTTPQENEQGFLFSKENKISIQFDKDISDFDIQLISRPFIEMEQIYDSINKTLNLTPKNEIKNFGSYTITIFVKHKKQEVRNFFPVGILTFNTLLPTPENWPKEFGERLLIARQSTAPKIKTGKYIDVNLEAQITTLFEDGKFVDNFINSPGNKETPTPKGEHQIYNKHPYALSNMFQVYMPYWMAFTSDGQYGFHDLPVWPEGHPEKPEGGKESLSSIGRAVSPGCVRHNAQDSQKIYNWSEVGTKLIIY